MHRNIARRSVQAAAAAVTTVAFVVSGAVMAFAQTATPDPTGGATTSTLSSITDWVQSYGAPLLAGLLVLGAIFVVLFKFVKKGARAV